MTDWHIYLIWAGALFLPTVGVVGGVWAGSRFATLRLRLERRRHAEEIEELTAAHLDEIETGEVNRARDAMTFRAKIQELDTELDRIRAANAALWERVNDHERQVGR